MKQRSFIAIPISLFLLLSFAASALGSSPPAEPPSPASVSTVASVQAAGGPVPGCPPAKEHLDLKVPADGGKAVRTIKAPFIFHAWWNNGHPSVVNKWWNPGAPPFPPDGQGQIKFMVRRGTWEIYGAGGNFWKYKANKACRRNLPFEFRNGKLPIKSVATLVELGLVRRIN